ncbi:MAG: OstA-like protein [Rikenellaceae bacterium]
MTIRKTLSIILILITTVVFPQNKTTVDYISDVTRLVKQGDSTVIKLIGHVAFYHNGAFITCDSAYRYSERKIEALGNVIINQNELNIYGDQVLYDGETNIAQIFSPLIKAIDNDAVMYSRDMVFNTDTQIGQYSNGATITQGDKNTMESKDGFYYAKTKDVSMRNYVEIDSEDYQMSNEELWFNMTTERVDFNVVTNIWSKDGKYLRSDKGNYDKANKIYNFESNSYILSPEQEGWSDTMVYYSNIDELLMRRDIQLVDTVQRMMTFGDYGYYWNKTKHVIMTKRPSVLIYGEDPDQDSVYISSDTLYVRPFLDKIPSKHTLDSLHMADSLHREDSIHRYFLHQDSVSQDSAFRVQVMRDSILLKELRDMIFSYGYDSTTTNALASDQVLRREYLSLDAKTGKYSVSDTTKLRIIGDSLKVMYFNNLHLTANKNIRLFKRSELSREIVSGLSLQEIDTIFSPNDIFKLKKPHYKDLSKGAIKAIKSRIKAFKVIYADSLKKARREERAQRMYGWLEKEYFPVDTTAIDSTVKKDTTILEDKITIVNTPDSSDYLVKAIRNAKIFKKDVQGVGDTIILETVDSTSTIMGREAVMWNEDNQVTAKRMRSYTENGEITRSRLFDNPIVSQHVERDLYNQLTGDYMDALFRDQAMYKLVVNKNSEALFYHQDKDSIDNEEYVDAFVHTTSKNMIIDLDSSQIVRIKWISDISTATYPIEKVPADVTQKLPDFVWYDTIRPKKIEVFDRVVRPSERKEVDKIKKPLFPITLQINDEKKRLIQQGWKDRTDKVRVNRNNFKK